MTSINHAELSPWQIPGYGWHMILPTLALSITSFAGLQPNHKAIIRRTAPGLYPDSAKGLPENRVMFMLSAMRSIR